MKKIIVLLTGFFIIYLFFFLFLYSYLDERYSIKILPLNTAFDAAVVFYGGFDNSGNPDKESMRRLSLAVNLYRKGMINNIIFAGGWRPSKNISGSELMAQKAAFFGIKANNIFIDTHSRDSIQNWHEAEKIINKNKFKHILLISSPFHLFRLQHLIGNNNDISIFYGTYSKMDAFPYKSFMENIIDYNYHMISFVTYLLIPSEWYQFLIEKIRK